MTWELHEFGGWGLGELDEFWRVGEFKELWGDKAELKICIDLESWKVKVGTVRWLV